MKRFLHLSVIIGVMITTTLAAAQDADSITLVYEALHPEGIEYHDGAMFVSSLTEGDVFRVEMDGSIEQFTDDERLVSSNGLWVDAENSRLLVANADVGVSYHSSEETAYQLSALGVYDLKTGAALDYYDLSVLLPGSQFANDMTMDDDGNIYLTNSFAPAIYRIDAQGEAAVWLTAETFAGEGFQLNGIVYHPDGYLIVARSTAGELYKIPIENPAEFSQIEVDPIMGADGLVLDDMGVLYVVTGEGAYIVESADDWQTGTVVATSAPPSIGTYTTGVLVAGDLWVVNSRFDVLFNPEAPEPVQEFEIVRVDFTESDTE